MATELEKKVECALRTKRQRDEAELSRRVRYAELAALRDLAELEGSIPMPHDTKDEFPLTKLELLYYEMSIYDAIGYLSARCRCLRRRRRRRAVIRWLVGLGFTAVTVFTWWKWIL